MKNAATQTAQDWVSLALAGLGLSLAPYEFFGGLFLSLAVASMLSGRRRHDREFWPSLLSATVFATLTALAWDQLGLGLPVQIGMAAAGVLSRPAAAFLVRLQDQIEARSSEIADRAIDKVLDRAEGRDGKGGRDDV